ncbi:Cellular Process Regulator and RNA Processing Protein [Pleurotus pulmonarius]
MARDSRSPPRRSRREDDTSRKYAEGSRRDRPSTHEDRGDQYDRRRRDRERDSESRQYGYGERERERERDRDRGRYDRDADRERRGGSSRRSKSPRSRQRSGSKSPPPVDKAKPNFGASGLLAAATNTVKAADGSSTVLKYNEPPEARKPTLGWRLYVFKGKEQVELLHIHRQSAYLIGRDRLVADIALEHPSCSKQHAAIQHRSVQERDEFGGVKAVIKPFIIDLESTNGTHVNDEQIPTSRFYELKAGDVIKFGFSG